MMMVMIPDDDCDAAAADDDDGDDDGDDDDDAAVWCTFALHGKFAPGLAPEWRLEKLCRQETPNSVGGRKSMCQIQATVAMEQ